LYCCRQHISRSAHLCWLNKPGLRPVRLVWPLLCCVQVQVRCCFAARRPGVLGLVRPPQWCLRSFSLHCCRVRRCAPGYLVYLFVCLAPAAAATAAASLVHLARFFLALLTSCPCAARFPPLFSCCPPASLSPPLPLTPCVLLPLLPLVHCCSEVALVYCRPHLFLSARLHISALIASYACLPDFSFPLGSPPLGVLLSPLPPCLHPSHLGRLRRRCSPSSR
jgi:hypothetical protein